MAVSPVVTSPNHLCAVATVAAAPISGLQGIWLDVVGHRWASLDGPPLPTWRCNEVGSPPALRSPSAGHWAPLRVVVHHCVSLCMEQEQEYSMAGMIRKCTPPQDSIPNPPSPCTRVKPQPCALPHPPPPPPPFCAAGPPQTAPSRPAGR